MQPLDTTYFPGQYTMDYEENLDECLKACGIGYIVRKLMALFRSTSELRQLEDGYWMARFKIGPKLTEFKFKPGETFDLITFQGKTTHVFTFEGGSKIKEVRTNEYGPCEVIREYSAEGITWIMTHLPSGVKCKGTAKRISQS